MSQFRGIQLGHGASKPTPACHKVAAILYFEEGATTEQVKRILSDLKDHLDHQSQPPYIEYGIVNDYNPEYGGPVWYIP